MNDFSGKNRGLSEELKNDIERLRGEFGKGMGLDEIADKLNMDRDYAEFLFWFGIV